MNSRASLRAIGGKPALTPTKKPLQPCPVKPTDLRVALFSGNYNYVRDGANQALNRLVEYLLRQGVQVRVYSPTVEKPAFPATGDLVDRAGDPDPGTVGISPADRDSRCASGATSSGSIRMSSMFPARTSSATGRSAGRDATRLRPSHRSTRGSTPISLIITCRRSSRWRAGSCGASIIAAKSSSRPLNRPARSFELSA